MIALFARADEIFMKCLAVLEAHKRWLSEVQGVTGCAGRLVKIDAAYKLTVSLQAYCRKIGRRIRTDQASFQTVALLWLKHEGGDLETLGSHDRVWCQKYADVFWKQLEGYKSQYWGFTDINGETDN